MNPLKDNFSKLNQLMSNYNFELAIGYSTIMANKYTESLDTVEIE